MRYLKRVESIVFYLTVFSIIIQLGKHFWPKFSFVEGIRIDYLSPTFYLSDFFIILLFVLVLLIRPARLFRDLSRTFILVFLFISILLSSFLAINQEAAFAANLKILEMLFFGWYVSRFSFSLEKLTRLVDIILAAGFIQSVVAIVQFVLQRSINGPLYYLGERSFNIDTIGIATFFANGRELVRPYGTFPHPNVLAFFLSIVLILGTSMVLSRNKKIRQYLYTAVLLVTGTALMLTAARTIILLTFTCILFLFIRQKKLLFLTAPALILSLSIYFFIFSDRFMFDSLINAIRLRMDLFAAFVRIFADNLLLGVGTSNSFFYNTYLADLPIHIRFQPVHNIYLYILTQFGILGSIPAGYFLYKSAARIIKTPNLFGKKKLFVLGVMLLFFEMLAVGFFDHFFVTLQQGGMITSLILGMIWNKKLTEGFLQEG